MRLSGYRFGRIDVDGVPYHHDVAVLPSGVREWWRREGHRVYPEDLGDALAEHPEIVVIGTGLSGLLAVTEEAERALTQAGVELHVARTKEAVDAYNELCQRRRACALLHLTC